MPWGKSEQQKQAEAEEKARQAAEAERAQAAEKAEMDAQSARFKAEWERREYLNTPVGQAEAAAKRGDRFLQVEIPVSKLSGAPSSFGSSSNEIKKSGTSPDVLGQIEDFGWRLEHAGFVFIETGSTSTNRVLSTGQGTVTRGEVQGFYLFRNTRPASSNADGDSRSSSLDEPGH